MLLVMLVSGAFLSSCEQDNPDPEHSIIVVNKKDRTPSTTGWMRTSSILTTSSSNIATNWMNPRSPGIPSRRIMMLPS